jgi:hypothetical protein
MIAVRLRPRNLRSAMGPITYPDHHIGICTRTGMNLTTHCPHIDFPLCPARDRRTECFQQMCERRICVFVINLRVELPMVLYWPVLFVLGSASISTGIAHA